MKRNLLKSVAGANICSAVGRETTQKSRVSTRKTTGVGKNLFAIAIALLLFCCLPVPVSATSLVGDVHTYTFSSSWQATASATITGGSNSYTFEANAGYTYHFTLCSSIYSGADDCSGGTLVLWKGSKGSNDANATAKDGSSCPYITFPCTSSASYTLEVRGSGLIPTIKLGYAEVPNSYTVTFDRQSGTGGTSSVTATSGASMPSATAPTRTGYTFGGYFSATNGSGTQYYSSSMGSVRTWNIPANTTLYAKWTANPYTVTLNNQSGTGGTSSVTVTYDASMPSATAPTRTGYTFGGYYTGTNGTGTQYYTSSMTSARTWNLAANTTLYAKWTANTYTVTLNAQSGTGGTASVTATYDALMPGATKPTRNGYGFGGYYTGTNGTGTQYYTSSMTSARTWNLTANTTLYAYWIGNTYSITTAENGGNMVADLSYTVTSSSQTKSLTAPTYPAYTVSYNANGYGTAPTSQSSTKPFSSWSITANSSSASSVSSNTLSIPANAYGNITVTAQWGTQQAITLPTPAVTGYTFGGWYSEASCTNFVANGGASYTPSANKTLYAKWTANTYTVVYNANGGTGTTASSSHTYGIAKKLTANGFTKTGYIFIGWATSASGTEAYSNEQSISNLTATNGATVTLYAKWVVDEELLASLLVINASLQEQIAVLQQDTTNLNAQIDALQSDTTNYLNQILALQGDTANLHNQIAELQESTESCNQNTALLLSQIAALQTDTANLHQQNTKLQNQLSAANQNITTLQNDLVTANNANNTLQMQNTDLQNQLSAASQSISSLQSDLNSCNRDKTELQNQVVNLNTQITMLNGQIATLQSEKTALENQLATANSTISTLQNDKTALQNQVATLNSQITTLNGQIATLQSEKTALENQLATANSTINTLQNDKTALQNQVATLNSQITMLNGEIASLQSDLNSCNGDKTELQNQISELENQVSALEDEITALNAQIVALQAALDECMTSGISKVQAADVKIYPNPAKTELFINSDLPVKKVEIYTLTGSLLLIEDNFNEKISVSALSSGIYMLKVYTDKGVAVSKVVKE
jgi:uncharacterized repeat protein (TIGR02543 family)